MKKHLPTIIIVLILLIGLSLLLYPTVSDYWNSFHQSRAIASYEEAVSGMTEDDYDRILEAARQYNDKLASRGFKWELSASEYADYESLLNVTGNGIMGYIEIESIKVRLPIYHGTDESILQIASGHLEGTSLPVGGETAHCVISGHRGLTSARLFTDLDQMGEGDLFTLHVLNETLTYQVDQIRIVLPEDLSNLALEKGKDYCTLVTCTPYGVNTHRLLVRGKRVENREEVEIVEDARQLNSLYVAAVVGVFMMVILFLFVMLSRRRGR